MEETDMIKKNRLLSFIHSFQVSNLDMLAVHDN